ncbi:SMI1/KNR4 family protein [Cupriavidus sp. 30B13]|uniref:SMI1/KNR4 family protein n=1 Tax=Cupriavidus sp. 30B13 TaxID=3384241 RepID=UPI003B914029
MAVPFEKLRDLAYRPYASADQHDPAVFAGLSAVVGYPVPQEYMDFLREFPDTGVFAVEGDVIIHSKEKLSGKHDGIYAIDMLFAASMDKRYDLMEIASRPVYDGDTPRYVLQIGQDLGGNAFCLDLRPETFGKVYFWDHEHSARETGLHLVADDFFSFLNGLQVEI